MVTAARGSALGDGVLVEVHGDLVSDDAIISLTVKSVNGIFAARRKKFSDGEFWFGADIARARVLGDLPPKLAPRFPYKPPANSPPRRKPKKVPVPIEVPVYEDVRPISRL